MERVGEYLVEYVKGTAWNENKNSMYRKGYKVEGEKNGRYLHSLNHNFKVNEIIEKFGTSL